MGEEATMLRPRNEVRRLKVAPRKAKPFAEINSGIFRRLRIRESRVKELFPWPVVILNQGGHHHDNIHARR